MSFTNERAAILDAVGRVRPEAAARNFTHMINRLTSCTALIALHLTCVALPKGAPPPTPMSLGGNYWNCVLPVKIGMRGPSIGYMATDLTSKVVSQFREGANVRVLKVRDVVLEPGIAEVTRDDFEHNDLSLSVGTEVYALAEWEFLYFHAWVNGLEIAGGLPLGDESYFKFIEVPKVERWVLFQNVLPPKAKSWVKYSDALRDDCVIQGCTRIQDH